ncbi:alpha/beta fold hydrolase [Nocardia alni]|uniref:alpha/beta fold hydrolase n=1 Tax=Nocardia alni TaxID=2815723 RepID=UPI001C21FEB8|nr:alpha/beta hydrolase [Nocardia alni]
MSIPPLSPPRYLDVDGGRIAYYDTGSGEDTIVWVHGLPTDSRAWSAQRDFFDTRARSIFLDLRGYGASDKIPADMLRSGNLSTLYIADLAALITRLELRRPMLVGFASAGHIALRLAATHPDLIGKLALLNGTPQFRRRPDWPNGFSGAEMSRFIDAATRGGIDPVMDLLLDPATVFTDVSPARAIELGDRFREMIRSAGVDTLLAFFESVALDDDWTLLRDIQAPTLVMTSTLGRKAPSGAALHMRTTIPHALLAELPGADHFAFATRPELVNQLLDAFRTTRRAASS